ncbi:MAG: L-serine ammonia-lyase, iron-sulfur-dependent, subunit alpha, partial [Clostridiaceae bacterium]|nr:L-serine ammonia-lyase, iron-sulfur-dependent, subunit alpha [Clostridiaceae bacterium]
IPACLTTLRDEYDYNETDICEALLTIAAVGYIVMLAGSVSGAEAGCQAEVGTASAMAAAGIAYLRGGDPDTLLQAASFAFGNILGMVCDPIRGLVESPCQQRNVIGAANAMVSADLAMAGIRSPVTFDGMVATMLSVGRRMPVDLRETGRGGMAHTAILECAQCVGGQFC